jgi:ABC-2 type transport system ATP-binding protein
MAVIKVERLTREFRRQKRKEGSWGAVQSLFSRDYEIITAVDSISFEVEKGEIIGYIGPNGAGKSTTVKILVGILVPTSGRVEVAGRAPYEQRVENARRIGVVFGQRTQLWWDIPISESFNLMRYMYDISERDYRGNLALFSDVLGIGEFLHVPARQLSLGQRMRADLCNALLHSPDILFLDEPTIGLDVEVKEKVREFIKIINHERSTTVILTTHDMSDVEKLCSRVIVIDRGHLMYDGTLGQLKRDYGADETLIVDTKERVADVRGLYDLGASRIVQEDSRLIIEYDRRKVNSADILSRLMERCQVLNFVVRETETEAVIRNLYKTSVSHEQAESPGGLG